MMNERLDLLRRSIGSVFLGNAEAVDRVLITLLARGHALIEDVPGVGKTVLATALARSIDCTFSRVQLTPDLLPGDILGVSVLNRETGEFEFRKGPIFANIVLADEINRTPPRTQTALLEAMSEASVTVDGVTRRLDPPFMLIATQNPYEFEGTYLLPENQLDRFLMRIRLGYPSPADEMRVLDLRPGERALSSLQPVMHGRDVVALQERVSAVRLDESLTRYIVELASRTRTHDEVQVGLSPRGSLALAQASRATAALRGRDYVVPEDILFNVLPVCAHRVITRSYLSEGTNESSAGVLQRIVEGVASPA